VLLGKEGCVVGRGEVGGMWPVPARRKEIWARVDGGVWLGSTVGRGGGGRGREEKDRLERGVSGFLRAGVLRKGESLKKELAGRGSNGGRRADCE
jgi:hypothetical protein